MKRLTALMFVGLVAMGEVANGPTPRVKGRTLDNQDIVLPDAASGKIALLLVGASKKGGDRTTPWRDHFLADFKTEPGATYYGVALLEGAPSLVRGMIRSGMRSGTPAPQRSHMVTSNEGQRDWVKYFNLTDDSLPMVLLLDRAGHAIWSYKGEFDDPHYQALKQAVSTALHEK